MKNVRKILALMSFLAVLTLFIGAVSAANYTVNDVELASTGVKNYTETHGNIPGYVDVSSKNSTTPSFLYTLTKTTVQLNAGSTAPVTISNVGAAPSPSGSATGTLYKSEYVNVASNINSFISSNGRAPNYASTSLGNVRYESLVYTYSNIINFYRYNNRLPNYVTVSNIAGIDSTGVVIDNVAPSVSNSLTSGSYNALKNLTLTATDHVDPNPTVYYSTNGGSTWSSKAKTVTLALNPGITTLKYYAKDATGNTGTIQTATYTINLNPIININTTKTYSRIQDAIADSSTLNGHIIEINSGTYTENIVLNKQLTLRPVSGGSVTIQANDALNPAITITSTGSGSTIQGFTIKGTVNSDGVYSDGIYLNGTSGCNITGNNLTGNYCGVYLSNSLNNKIQNNTATSNNYGIYLSNNSNNNTIQNNTATDNWRSGPDSSGIYLDSSNNNIIQSNTLANNNSCGIRLLRSNNNMILNNTAINNNIQNVEELVCVGIDIIYSSNNTIQNNNVTSNGYGIEIIYSSNITVSGNSVTNNTKDGIYVEDSSANINFNRIVGNSEHGLHNRGSNTIDATNNWWGSNSPVVSSSTPSDIYIESGTVIYNPWLSEDILL